MKYRFHILCNAVAFLFSLTSLAQPVTPLAHGHAHNDYVHKRPLFEALDNGFTSIEIDVYLQDGKLKVAHLPIDLDSKKTIEELYFEPIQKIITENGGTVYKGYSTPVIFMIDFKTSGETYAVLKDILKHYESIITVYKNDSVIHQRAIQILISGNAPQNELLNQDSSIATMDAGVQSLNDANAAKVSTRYSSAWGNYFKWKGIGTISPEEKAKLDSLITKAHEMKKQIRFYHIPDKPKAWKVLLDAKVDWINTNKLSTYRRTELGK